MASKTLKCNRKNRRGQYVDNDQTADLEYVIPKVPHYFPTKIITKVKACISMHYFQTSETNNRKPSMDTTVQIYAKSWVFEGTTEDEYHQTDDSSSISICSLSSPVHSVNPAANNNHKSKNGNHNQKSKSGRRPSDATSERFNQQMSSFSRCATPSPVPYSEQASPANGPASRNYLEPSSFTIATFNGAALTTNGPIVKPKPNRLTVDYVATEASPAPTIVKIAPKVQQTSSTNSNGPSSISSSQPDGQFASLLAELEHTLMDKKLSMDKDLSPDSSSLTACSSKSSSKDLEFSKELEAALQMIQDLETPSEGPADHAGSTICGSTKIARSESEKTLSAAISLPSPEAVPFSPLADGPPTPTQKNGKYSKRNVIIIEPNSQSTSGYSSPNSFSSKSQSTAGREYALIKDMSPHRTSHEQMSISNDPSNVVRIYIEPGGVTNSNNLLKKSHILSASNLMEAIRTDSSRPLDSINKSFLLFKKRSKMMQQNDFQSRIFKSECLAYLSDEELVQRHRCNRDVIRVRDLTLGYFFFGTDTNE